MSQNLEFRLRACMAGLLFALLSQSAFAAAATGEIIDAVIGTYSPYAEQHEFLRRAMMPTTADRMLRYEQAGKTELKPHVLDLSQERLDAYVPRQQPAEGYGVLVFIPPTPSWQVPRSYIAVLEARGIIWVAARKSGNAQNVFERRMPLALHALAWAEAHYRINPKRRYISGFSGGGRVAQRVALAFPDVFSGAMLIAGSDPLDENGAVIPSPDLFRLFQTRTRIAHVTGANDLVNRAHDRRTRDVMQRYCVAHLFKHVQSRTDHWIPPKRGFAKALADIDLERPAPADYEACASRLQEQVAAGKQAVQTALSQEQYDLAGTRLAELEARFGGLAAPESVQWARLIAYKLTPQTTATPVAR